MKTRAIAALCGCLVLVSLKTHAALLSFDDGVGGQNGVLSYDGNGGALTGSGIDFDSVLGDGTPSNSGVSLDCVGCTLNFTTGNNVNEGPFVWEFSGGGLLQITGTVMIGSTTIATGTLVSGSFTSAIVSGNGVDNSVLIMSGFGIDSKDGDLVAYFGLGVTDYTFASTNISLGNVDYLPNGGFSGTVTNADLDNLPVPVPPALWLFGSGLLGVIGISRRKNPV